MSKTRYLVTAASGFRGHAEGEEFEAELSEAEERRAKARGSIRVLKRPEKAATKQPTKPKEEAGDG